MPHDPRDALAARQSALVAALLDGAPAPAGFAPGALATAAHVVGHKRAGIALTRRPRRWRRSLVFTIVRLVRRLFPSLRDRAASW